MAGPRSCGPRGVGIKRSGPLTTRTQLQPGKPLRQGKPLKQVGARKKAEIKSTSKWRREYLAESPTCEIGQHLAANGVPNDCTGEATCLHERVKRSAQGSLVDPANLMRACSICNGWIEDNPKLARKLGLALFSYQLPADCPLIFV
jgi:hypothetical protein